MPEIKNERMTQGNGLFIVRFITLKRFEKLLVAIEGDMKIIPDLLALCFDVAPGKHGCSRKKLWGYHAQFRIIFGVRLIWYGRFSCIQIHIEPSSANCLKGNANGFASKGE